MIENIVFVILVIIAVGAGIWVWWTETHGPVSDEPARDVKENKKS